MWDARSGECLLTLWGHSDSVSLVVFSHDSTRLASASWDHTVKVWDARSGECLQTIEVEQVPHSITFDSNDNSLYTNIGVVDISTSSISTTALLSIEPQTAQHQGVALSGDGTWITYNSENLLKLPSEYRPNCSAVAGDIIAIGVGNGRVWMCEVHSSLS
jgi:WD40 repeat protein